MPAPCEKRRERSSGPALLLAACCAAEVRDSAAIQRRRKHRLSVRDTKRRHFRKISREINKVATKPISSSIFPSKGKGLAWLAGDRVDSTLACDGKQFGRMANAPAWINAVKCTREACTDAAADTSSGCLSLVERQRRNLHMFAMLDSATRCAYAALFHHVANAFLAFAAAQCDAEFELQLVERVHSSGNGGSDFSVGHCLADTDNHGRSR
jgi:hypothetical protein